MFAMAQQAIGKEADHVRESEFIGKDAGPNEHPLIAKDQAKLLAFIAAVQKQYVISDRKLTKRAHVSDDTLRALREGKATSHRSLGQLARAAEALRREAGANETEATHRLGVLRGLVEQESANKLPSGLASARPTLVGC